MQSCPPFPPQGPSAATRAPRRLLVLLAAVFALVAILVPASAQARQARLYAGSFGLGPTNPHGPVDPYPLGEVFGIAVQTAAGPSQGDVYVSDGANHRVEKFDSSGHFLLMFGKEVNKTAVEEGATRSSEDGVCPAAGHPADVCQPGTAGTAPGSFGGGANGAPEAMSLAVDNSAAAGVYVGDLSDGTVTKFDESGHLITSWASGGQLDGSTVTTPLPGPFDRIAGLAVSSAGDLWVYGDGGGLGRIFEFSSSGSPITDWSTNHLFEVTGGGLAVDSEEDVYVGSGQIEKFGPDGTRIGAVNDSSSEVEQVRAFAVDGGTGDLFAEEKVGSPGEPEAEEVVRYDSSCHPQIFEGHPCSPAETFANPHLPFGHGLALDSSTSTDTIYIARLSPGEVAAFAVETVPGALTAKPSGLSSTAATLDGVVEPEGVPTTHCYFEWGTTTAYGNRAPCAQGEVLSGSGQDKVSAPIAGLTPGATYHYRLVASNANTDLAGEPSTGVDFAFGPPRIDSTSALEVSAESATVSAEIDPQDVPTSYRFEYLTEVSYQENGETFAGARQAPAEPESLGSADIDTQVSQHLQGLVPHTAYRYRVIAESALAQGPEAVFGPPASFATQAPTAFALPDDRGWELVSPPDKGGAGVMPITNATAIQAAASGGAIVYSATGPTEPLPAGSAGVTAVLSARGPGGWASRDLTVPHAEATVAGGNEFLFFSEDLSSSVVQPAGALDPALSPAASEVTPFLYTDFAPSGPPAFCGSSCARPLVTGCPGAGEPCSQAVEALADVPPGTVFGLAADGSGKTCPPEGKCGAQSLGASADLRHVVLESTAPLAAAAPKHELYEVSADAPPAEALRLVSVLPDGSPAVSQPALGLENALTPGAISPDGSRVVWAETGGQLFLRVNATREQSAVSGAAVDGSQCTEPEKACTVQLDALQGGSGGTGIPRFKFASTDGSRVFFTDVSRLTADSGALENKPDLYEYDLARPPGERLVDLTPSGGEPADVRANPLGASADGAYIYFVANDVLAPNTVDDGGGAEAAAPGDCTAADNERSPVNRASRSCNLYLRHDGTTTFLAALSGADLADWDGADESFSSSPIDQTARVSSNGRWLAFMSQRPLTGYDNRDAASGARDQEVFLYHAPAPGGGEGQLVCASCNPTGARPHGVEYSKLKEGTAGFSGGKPSSTWIAADVPVWSGSQDLYSLARHQPRYLSDSGRLFFDSTDALVSSDSNGVQDVYQYEPPSSAAEAPPADGCTEADPGFSPASGGCVDLISSGASDQDAAFFDASESGEDVFFLTTSRLSSNDDDAVADVYDARVGGGESEAPKPVECTGDACQSPVSAPNDPTPASLTFSGPGNLITPLASPPAKKTTKKAVKCKKPKKLSRGKCVKPKKKKAKRASHGRGAKR